MGLVAVAGLWMLWPILTPEALADYFHPASVLMMPLPEECLPTNVPPPTSAMKIIDDQRIFYHLIFQKVLVCRMVHQYPNIDAALGSTIRRQWLPLYVGCCSSQFRRHVSVVVARVDERGTAIVEAALLRSE